MQADSRDEIVEFVSYHTTRIESITNRKNDSFWAANLSGTVVFAATANEARKIRQGQS
jgi:hypothetical protein